MFQGRVLEAWDRCLPATAQVCKAANGMDKVGMDVYRPHRPVIPAELNSLHQNEVKNSQSLQLLWQTGNPLQRRGILGQASNGCSHNA